MFKPKRNYPKVVFGKVPYCYTNDGSVYNIVLTGYSKEKSWLIQINLISINKLSNPNTSITTRSGS